MKKLEKELLNSPSGPFWKPIGIYPHHGINLPLSSLHSKNSCGIGEFYDLLPVIDWCQKLKLDVIQLLPLNSSEYDPSPYNAIASCALNFLNISLHSLPELEQLPKLKKQLKEFNHLSNIQRLNYAEVQTHKLSWLRAYFDAVGDTVLKSHETKNFISKNSWVETYALFKSIKDDLANAPISTWPSHLKNPSDAERKELLNAKRSHIDFHIFLQYLCFSQMTAVKKYANARGVFLMGDVPILLSMESADVWEHPEFFDTHLTAGAPPDFYTPEGQCWGFPLFQWDVLRKDHFSWWKRRLYYASHFYNLYRIDHIIGFFRIWAVPPNHSCKEGFFVPDDESLWEGQGRELLTMMNEASPMLAIGEDLGVVPPIVRPILEEMGICGTKVMRWERNWETDQSFINIKDYPPISLTTLSTHDSETLQLWWKTFPEEATVLAKEKHWTYALDLTLSQRKELLFDSHHTSSLFHINLLQEYLALFPDLVWDHPEDERINIPGTILPTNWTYRFRPSIEEIVAHPELFQAIQEILFSKERART